MERRMVSMNWDQLDELDDDGEFYESTNRISAVVPLDVPLSESDYDEDDDQEFDDSRVSFSNNVSCKSIKEIQNVTVAAAAASSAQYEMWMMEPGSITDRRRKLLQGMGLNSKKDFARIHTTKLNKVMTKRVASRLPDVTSPEVNISNEKPISQTSVVKEFSDNLDGLNKEEHKQPQLPPQPQPQPQLSKPQPQQQHESQLELEPELEPKLEPEPKPKPEHEDRNRFQDQNQAQPSSSHSVLIVRCRSDSDIDTSSFNTKRRKEEMIGSISKQRLTRTSSELIAPSVGLSCQYANVLRVSTELPKKSSANKKNTHQPPSSEQFDSFFLIKNLDTGKEFVVKEYNEEGVWNKVSDLQTGKQLTMDEFEKTVGHSPVVKELMRRASRKKNGNSSKLASTNSYLSKSFRNSKKKGVAILKNLKSSVSGSSKTEKEKDNSVTTSATDSSTSSSSQSTGEKKTTGEKKPSGETKTTGEKKPTGEKKRTGEKKPTGEKKITGEQKTSGEEKTTVEKKSTGEQKKQKIDGGQKSSTDKSSASEWVKSRAHGKPIKEFSALHLCQEIQAHDGPIWAMRFSIDGLFLASAGEDKVIHVWEVQECDVMSMRATEDDKSSGVFSDNKPPLPDNSAMAATEKKKKGKNGKKKGEVPDYAKVPEAMFGLSEKPVCTFEGHQEDVLDLSWSRSQ